MPVALLQELMVASEAAAFGAAKYGLSRMACEVCGLFLPTPAFLRDAPKSYREAKVGAAGT